MADYSHLRAYDVGTDTTAEYVFEDIPGRPTILCAPAVDANAVYLNERLRISIERNKQPASREDPTPEALAAELSRDRDVDRVVIAKTCARSWGKRPPVDAAGKSHPFSEAECLDFLRAVPDYMFDPFRNWLSNIRNFTPRVVATPADAEMLGNA